MQLISKVTDARCPCGQAACESKLKAVAARREAIIAAQEHVFDEACENPHVVALVQEIRQTA